MNFCLNTPMTERDLIRIGESVADVGIPDFRLGDKAHRGVRSSVLEIIPLPDTEEGKMTLVEEILNRYKAPGITNVVLLIGEELKAIPQYADRADEHAIYVLAP